MDAQSALNGGETSAALNGAYGQFKSAQQNADKVMAQEDAAMQPTMQKFQQVTAQPIPTPPEPKKAAPAPSTDQFNKDAQGWIGAIAALSALVGARGRGRGTAALKAYAAGLDGIKQGNQQSFDNSYKEWKANTEAMQKENDEEMAKYKAVIENRELSESEQTQAIKMIGYEYNNKVTSAINSADQAFAVYDSQVKAQANANAMVEKMDAKKKANDEAQDQRDAKLQETLKIFPTLKDTDIVPGIGMTKAGILQKVKILNDTGDNYPAAGISMRSMNNPLRDFVDAVKAQSNPDQDVVKGRSNVAEATSEAHAIGRRAGTTEVGVGEFDQLIEPTRASIHKLDFGQWKDLNAFKASYDEHVNDPDYIEALNNIQELQNAYTSVLTRGGVRTDAAQSLSEGTINKLFGSAGSDRALDTMAANTKRIMTGVNKAKAGTVGQPDAAPAAGAPAGGAASAAPDYSHLWSGGD
jgi:hypothetical protein